MLFRWIKWLAGSLVLFSGFVFADIESSVKEQANACFNCHGVNGVSTNPAIPHIAGQNEEYLINQLKAFQSGLRNSPLMNNVSKTLSAGEIQGLALFFSKLDLTKGSNHITAEAAGKQFYSQCWSCHGEKGEGAGSYPRLAGQQITYLIQQMKKFKSGERKNPAMQAIAAGISEYDMKMLAAYIGSLKP